MAKKVKRPSTSSSRKKPASKVKKPTAKAAPKFAQNKPPPTEASLEKIRAEERKLRDLILEIQTLGEKTSEANKKKNKIETETLPDLFNAVGIDNLGIPADGNTPAFDGKLKPYYRANIAAGWEEAKRQKAFDWLIKHGHGDLIKTEICIYLGRDEQKLLAKIKRLLKPVLKQIDFSVELSVPHTTLSAFVREQIEVHKAVLPLDTLGAQVGEVVELKPRKEKKKS